MKEIIIHARAGQGAITTASIIGDALFQEGKYSYSFPSFGAARMGAPMNAYVRIDDKPVRLRSKVQTPDYLIVIDATLLQGYNIFSDTKSGAIAIINQKEQLSVENSIKAYCIPANEISQEILGKQIANTVLVGAFAYVSKEFSLESLNKAIQKRFKGKLQEQNLELVKRGYEYFRGKNI